MKFVDFISIEGYSIADKNHLKRTMMKFFYSALVVPYLEATLRADEETSKKIKLTINPLLEQYYAALNSTRFMQQADWVMELLLKESPATEEQNKAFEDAWKQIRPNLLPMSARDPDVIAIEYQIRVFLFEQGSELIYKEHRSACVEAMKNCFEQGRLIGFHEFTEIAWSHSEQTGKAHTFTREQYLSYLGFVYQLLAPIAVQELSSTNKNKATEFFEEYKKILGKIEKSVRNYDELLKSIDNLEEKERALTVEYDQLAPGDPGEGHTGGVGCFATTTPEHIALLKKIDESKTVLSSIDIELSAYMHFLTEYDGSIANAPEELKKMQEIINFWQDNIPKLRRRAEDVSKLHSFKCIKDNKYDVISREVSDGEAMSLRSSKNFSQAPQSFEREKWFFYGNGKPSVDHEYLCTIHLYSGALDLLKSLQKPDGQFATIIQKGDAEPDCFGIHEDALPYLNKMVHHVEIRNTKKPGNAVRVDFEDKANLKLPDIFLMEDKGGLDNAFPYSAGINCMTFKPAKVATDDVVHNASTTNAATPKPPK